MTDTNFKIIGLTGPSGAGKTTVARTFRKSGITVVDADEIAHKVLEYDECRENLVRLFGGCILGYDGEIDRKKLGRLVFHSNDVDKLNQATHPVIAKLALAEFEKAKERGERLVVFDAPTLIESGLHKECDKIISVIATELIRFKRVQKRDFLTYTETLDRFRAQGDDSFYTYKSDYVIENNGTKEELEEKAQKLIEELLS